MSVLDPVVVDSPLSVAMREGSQAAHTAAETSPFMAELTGGRVNAVGYLEYLMRFREVYAALEETGRRLADAPAAAAVVDPALERLPSIEADLAHWRELAGRPDIVEVQSPAATAYAERVRAAVEWAPLFVAHHYTRYLGDLSGGQVVGRALDRAFGLGGQGIGFYRFEEIPKPKPYKDGYRARLDALGLTVAERQRVVEEVSVAFDLNQAIFTELGSDIEAYRA